MPERDLRGRFESAFSTLNAIGQHPDGGWTRLAWTPQDRDVRGWFTDMAAARGMPVEVDRAGNQWAWWGGGDGPAVATGSHLDTVPNGGAFDGALGVVSAFLAVDEFERRGVDPGRPVAIVAFTDEEGGRYNTPCLGSRLLTGEVKASSVVDRVDADGVALGDAMLAAGVDPASVEPEPERLQGLGCFVELHVEQGRAMVDRQVAVAQAKGIWPHGRWRLVIEGEPNHAGTTRLEDRRDPMMVLADAVRLARSRAAAHSGVATVGRVQTHPNSSNSIAGRVTAWLDARAVTDGALLGLLEDWRRAVAESADAHGCAVALTEEALTPAVRFDEDLIARLEGDVTRTGRASLVLPTAAGHDAGILSAYVPTAMLFVRNPTGISHSPAEHADTDDCVEGVRALSAAMETLASR